ncbi:MAG TPA: hypothetical protein VHH35_18685, partial [Pyrinomonadaceae bacterium]|nr:hypothetical protein [Pyrinomonadaceae bacterium]
GKLPEPARLPPGTVDQQAAALAKAVSLRDESSTAALHAAILAAGFAVRDDEGGVTHTVEPGQGLTFDAWEVAAIAKMYGEGRDVELVYLTEGLRSIPELKQVSLDRVLLDGIRAHAQGDHPLRRFLARFIVELGRNAGEPYDILNSADQKTIRLDALQAALILRRLYGDLYAMGQRDSQAAHVRNARFLRASYVTRGVPAQGAQQPCGGVGSQPVHDAMALVLTQFWGGLFGETRMGKAVNIANVLLAYAQLIATYAALETEITVENAPLVRTKNATPGERRRLTAKVTMNIGDYQKFNCFRHMLNFFTGLDFKLLDDGPIEGAEVHWHVEQELDAGNRGIAGITDGGPRIQDAGTYAGVPGRPGVAVRNATRSKTDKNGIARTFLEGTPKIPYVAPPLRTVMKDVTVRTTIRLKAGDIKGDAVDLAGQLLGGVGGLITMPIELLYRTDWASTAWLTVAVKDHERCDGEWYGTITYRETFKDARAFQERNQTGQWTREESYAAALEITGTEPTPSQIVMLNTRVKARATTHESRYGRGTSTSLCNLENKMTSDRSGNLEQVQNIGLRIMPDGRYIVSYVLPSVDISGQMKKSRNVLECKNPFIKPEPETTSPVRGRVSVASPDIEGLMDPANPNELKGSKTVDIPERNGTRTGMLTWNFVRCAR